MLFSQVHLLMVQLLSKVKSNLNSRMQPLLHKGRWDSLKRTQLYKQGWWHTLTSMLPEVAEREREEKKKKREKIFHQAAGRTVGVPGRCPPWGVHLVQELLELPDGCFCLWCCQRRLHQVWCGARVHAGWPITRLCACVLLGNLYWEGKQPLP